RTRSRPAGAARLRSAAQRPAVAAAAQRAGAAGARRRGSAAARRTGRPARTRQHPPHRRDPRRTAGDHGLPRSGARQPPAHDSRNERPAARDGGHRALRAVQPWPSHLDALQPGGDRPMVPARTLMLLVAALLLAACNLSTAPSAAQQAAKAKAAAEFAASEQAWRDQRLAELTKPDGWASLVGMHWLDPG